MLLDPFASVNVAIARVAYQERMNGDAIEQAPRGVAQPSWVNYCRVFLDIIMVGLLLCVVATSVRVQSTERLKAVPVHEVPIYVKQNVDYVDMWNKAISDTDVDEMGKVRKFQAAAATACEGAELHPMCGCIQNATTEETAKNCLLQYPIPSRNSDWNMGSVSCSMVVWFMASLATSIGTLPFINSHTSFVGYGQAHTTLKWHRAVVVAYVCATIATLTVPFIVVAVQFPESPKHMEALLNILTWGVLAIVAFAAYNSQTILGYLSWTNMEEYGSNNRSNAELERKKMSVHNWILYVHLLVSAPAIAMVVHINQSWTEYNTILNTTFIISSIFAVDGFSAEMANYWQSKANAVEEPENQSKAALLTNDTSKKQEFNDTQKRQAYSDVMQLHKRLGLVRLFAWATNAVLLLLLFTLAYPLEVEHGRISSALFVVLVIMFAAVFLVPDLVREFTDGFSFNNIQFRLYGDFVLRSLVLFFVWRSSVSERI